MGRMQFVHVEAGDGSEIFVVHTDERDTAVSGYPGLRNKALVVKVNRLFRF